MMGTRHLTIVIDKNNILKVAQYGQWDGYPAGQGITILNFIKDKNNINLLEKRFDIIKFYNTDTHDIDKYIDDYNKKAPEWTKDPDNRTAADRYWWDMTQSRDLGGDILYNLISLNLELLPQEHNKNIYLFNDIDFLKDSLMCEYAYCINLYRSKFMIFKGFNKDKSKEHQFCKTSDEEIEAQYKDTNYRYYGCELIKEYDLNELPDNTTFLHELNEILKNKCEE